jgi:protein-disulfide isomerase
VALRTPPEAEAGQSLAEYCTDNPDRCFTQGDTNAPVTMVEVSDFGCPHCQTFHLETASQLEESYVESGNLRWIALPYALSASTLPASIAAMCAGEQDSYFEFSHALFAIEPTEFRVSLDGLRQAAGQVDLDIDAFNTCLDAGRFTAVINQNREAAREVQVTGTPTFFVEDIKLVGAQPFTAFAQAIESIMGN